MLNLTFITLQRRIFWIFFYQKMEPENDQLFCLFINFNFQVRISTLKEKNSSSASKLDNYSLRQKLVGIEGTKRFDMHNK